MQNIYFRTEKQQHTKCIFFDIFIALKHSSCKSHYKSIFYPFHTIYNIVCWLIQITWKSKTYLYQKSPLLYKEYISSSKEGSNSKKSPV